MLALFRQTTVPPPRTNCSNACRSSGDSRSAYSGRTAAAASAAAAAASAAAAPSIGMPRIVGEDHDVDFAGRAAT